MGAKQITWDKVFNWEMSNYLQGAPKGGPEFLPDFCCAFPARGSKHCWLVTMG